MVKWVKMCIDTETGGFWPTIHALCQLGACTFNKGGRIKGTEFCSYVNYSSQPGKKFDPKAIEVNGLTLDQLETEGVGIDVLREMFIDYLESFRKPEHKGAYIIPVGHNYAEFDSAWLKMLLGEEVYATYFRRAEDTQHYARYLQKIGVLNVKSYSLVSLRRHFRMRLAGAHDAMNDVYDTIRIYNRLVYRIGRKIAVR